jgi:hypothetical protein
MGLGRLCKYKVYEYSCKHMRINQVHIYQKTHKNNNKYMTELFISKRA